MYFVKTPAAFRFFLPSLLFRIPSEGKTVYLTFDDGPTPGVTEFALDELKKHGAKATFFCVGKNVAKYPELYQRILDEDHSVGNHTMHHLNGWRNGSDLYKLDVDECSDLVKSDLFRPPYGKITPAQIRSLKKRYRIIMWDLLCGDFDEKVSADECLNRIKLNYRDGSIITMHDNEKAGEKLRSFLPLLLDYFKREHFRMEKIEAHAIS